MMSLIIESELELKLKLRKVFVLLGSSYTEFHLQLYVVLADHNC